MSGSVSVELSGRVAEVLMHRPPANFFDEELLGELAETLLQLDADPAVRAIVLGSEGKHFCAGADLRDIDAHGLRRVYRRAFSIFTARTPVVAAVQGSAIGGGLGLALAADFRVAGPGSRFSANFARLGFHQGFGLSVTLPAVVGRQKALDLLLTGRAVRGEEALSLGLCDRLVPAGEDAEAETGAVLAEAHVFAASIAESAPLSLVAIRATLRRGLVAEVQAALDVEATAQTALLHTADFREGVSASVARRDPQFIGE